MVSSSDETPDGRASAALRLRLPALFPEHMFEFVGRDELTEVAPEARDELLFRVLATEVRSDDDQLIGECAGPELVEAIQSVVDEIVASARSSRLFSALCGSYTFPNWRSWYASLSAVAFHARDIKETPYHAKIVSLFDR